MWTIVHKQCRGSTEDDSNVEDTDNTEDNAKKVESGDDGVGIGKERRVNGNLNGNGGGTGPPFGTYLVIVRHGSSSAQYGSNDACQRGSGRAARTAGSLLLAVRS